MISKSSVGTDLYFTSSHTDQKYLLHIHKAVKSKDTSMNLASRSSGMMSYSK